jgi:hypothetical protein
MKKYILAILAMVSMLSCKKDTYVDPDYIVFGSIEGDCGSGCRFVYYLDATKLAEDSTAKYFSTRDLHAFTRELPQDKFNIAKELLGKVPTALTKTTRNIFIDLNASSPNLWYAEVKTNGRVYSWTFDNSASGTPAYLKSFADEMIRVIGLIHP